MTTMNCKNKPAEECLHLVSISFLNRTKMYLQLFSMRWLFCGEFYVYFHTQNALLYICYFLQVHLHINSNNCNTIGF